MFVIRFKPGGAYPFLGRRIDEFANEFLNAETVFGDKIFRFRDELLAAADPDGKFDAGLSWLTVNFDEKHLPHAAITESIKKIVEDPHFQEKNLAQLIEESGYSKKQFISLFTRYVGITPKYFQRIVRFNEILLKIHNSEKLSWTEISYDCGFYDQAHFIKEFQHFCGYNPNRHLDNPMIDQRVNFFPVD